MDYRQDNYYATMLSAKSCLRTLNAALKTIWSNNSGTEITASIKLTVNYMLNIYLLFRCDGKLISFNLFSCGSSAVPSQAAQRKKSKTTLGRLNKFHVVSVV